MRTVFGISVGMSVCLEPTGNFTRMYKRPFMGTVTSIGRKYFYVSVQDSPHWGNVKFDLETFNCHYDDNAGFILYPSFEAYKAEKTAVVKLREIRDAVCYAQNLNRIPNHKIAPSHDAIDKIYQILCAEGLLPEWKEDMIHGG